MKLAKALNNRDIPILLDEENRPNPIESTESVRELIFIRVDGTEINMVSQKGSRSHPVGHALGVVDVLFKNKSDLFNTLDPRTADQDDRIRAIKDGPQLKFDFTNEQMSGVWPRVRTCVLSKRRNQHRLLREELKTIDFVENGGVSNQSQASSTQMA